MNSATAQRLVALNRQFYDRSGTFFSATRRRIQPGVRRVLGTLRGEESILDLGCGNGELARALAGRNHRGRYVGVDFSPVMLREAEHTTKSLAAHFLVADLTTLAQPAAALAEPLSSVLRPASFDLVLALAVLHHMPSSELRLGLLRMVGAVLKPKGQFTHSSWQFMNSRKLAARIQPWEAAQMSAADVDAGDHLLDWRGGGTGLRYVHQFSPAELADLASQTGFRIRDTFYSDGQGGRLGLYQVWLKD
jgi:SAM-dependent methyltransferase